MLIANFLIDIAYVIVDPRTRVGCWALMAVSGRPETWPSPAGGDSDVAEAPPGPLAGGPPRAEFLYFARRNTKFAIG